MRCEYRNCPNEATQAVVNPCIGSDGQRWMGITYICEDWHYRNTVAARPLPAGCALPEDLGSPNDPEGHARAWRERAREKERELLTALDNADQLAAELRHIRNTLTVLLSRGAACL